MQGPSTFYVKWGTILVSLSALTYGLHYLMFRDAHHLGIFLMSDIAFVFLEVLLVSLIIHRLIEAEDAQNRLEKLNMVIGAFFSEIGNILLRICVENDPDIENYRGILSFEADISAAELSRKFNSLHDFKAKLKIDRESLHDLRRLLMDSKDFQLRLVENPVILEHEKFSDLLRSVLHLTEELVARVDLREIPDKDLEHITNDIERAYGFLAREWFAYVQHMQKEYPYLFSFMVRTNPFKLNPSAVFNDD